MSYTVLPRYPGEFTERFASELEDTFRIFTPTLTPTSVGANTTSEQAFTVTGIRSNDFLLVNGPTSQTAAIGIVNIKATARDTVTITFMHNAGGGATPVSGVYTILAIRGQ